MPVTSFLSNIADKAQAAVNSSPLAGHLPASLQRVGTSNSGTQPTANQAAVPGGVKYHTLENIQHQFRSLQQQISNTSRIQKIVTSEKGIVIDFDGIARDCKGQSKELYTWGQSEADDLKDVTDRLAYLNFVQGSVAGSLSVKLDGARGPLKALRNAEAALQPGRNTRTSLQNQIAKIETEAPKAGSDKRVVELREQLYRVEQELQQQERDLELTKRKALRESEAMKWDAIREYGEKLVLLSQAATPIINVLPSMPPTQASPYSGAQTTGAVRGSLQQALDNYKTGQITLPAQVSGADLSRTDMRSFGESHAAELSKLAPSQPVTASPPATAAQFSPPPPSQAVPTNAGAQSGGIPPGYETAEQEKQRLERERAVPAGGNGANPAEDPKPADDDDDWPAYEE